VTHHLPCRGGSQGLPHLGDYQGDGRGIPPVTHPTDPSIHVCRVGRVPRNPPELEREWVNPRDHLCMVKVPVSYFREDGVLGCRKTPLQRVGWILPPPPHPSFSFLFFFFFFFFFFSFVFRIYILMWQICIHGKIL
jgi:hypothetical protein